MNVHDSEKIAFILESLGYSPTPNREDADVIVFNTCAIREGAEDRMLGNVGALKKLKRDKKDLIIVVAGCASQKPSTHEYIKKKFPFVDIIIGTFNMPKLGEYILTARQKKVREIWQEGDIDEKLSYSRSSGDNAWVNIMQGCNNFCTYCIVPYVRGREKSREVNDILAEIKALVSSNKYKKITLLGQNVNSYGKDLNVPVTFSQLLHQITQIEGDFKVTFMTSHPKDITDELIDEISENPKIIKSLHLPAQSGNDRILSLMNRRYTRQKYLDIIKKLKQKVPNITLTSDFIVGFPTETEEEFEDTLSLVKEVGFDGIFAFIYSPREGTVASTMDGQIDEKIKHERVNRLLEAERQVQAQKRSQKD